MSVPTAIREASRASTLLRTFALTTLGAVALALLTQVDKIYLGETPIPFTLQVFAVIMLGGLLGPRLAVAAVAEYLLMGIFGLPVFSHWQAGFATLTGMTGGYLIGFLGAAVLCGVVYGRVAARPYRWRVAGGLVAGVLGVAVIYLCGWLWLACWGHMHLAKAFQLGVMPFIIPDILKVSLAATVLALRTKGA